jgi:hypothetical protein
MLYPDAGPGRLVHSGTVAPFPAPFDQRFSPADQPGSGRELAGIIRTGPPSSRRSSCLDYMRVYQDASTGHFGDEAYEGKNGSPNWSRTIPIPSAGRPPSPSACPQRNRWCSNCTIPRDEGCVRWPINALPPGPMPWSWDRADSLPAYILIACFPPREAAPGRC